MPSCFSLVTSSAFENENGLFCSDHHAVLQLITDSNVHKLNPVHRRFSPHSTVDSDNVSNFDAASFNERANQLVLVTNEINYDSKCFGIYCAIGSDIDVFDRFSVKVCAFKTFRLGLVKGVEHLTALSCRDLNCNHIFLHIDISSTLCYTDVVRQIFWPDGCFSCLVLDTKYVVTFI